MSLGDGGTRILKTLTPRSGEAPQDGEPEDRYSTFMKKTAANPNTATERQGKDSRQNTGPGAASSKSERTHAAESASQRATAHARRGEPLKADSKSDRSPKQENL
jgi:hypothetical protein